RRVLFRSSCLLLSLFSVSHSSLCCMRGTRGQEGWGGGVLSVAIAVQEGLFTHTLQKATTPSSCSTQHREEWETENRDNRRQETHFTLVRRKEMYVLQP